jgi:hypothetical protein
MTERKFSVLEFSVKLLLLRAKSFHEKPKNWELRTQN